MPSNSGGIPTLFKCNGVNGGRPGICPCISFGVLGTNDSDGNESLANTVATQVAALTYQSQLTQTTAATTGQCQEMQLAQLATAQEAQHATMHQLIEGLNAVAFNVSNAGCGFA
jgi:hypothetical protein